MDYACVIFCVNIASAEKCLRSYILGNELAVVVADFGQTFGCSQPPSIFLLFAARGEREGRKEREGDRDVAVAALSLSLSLSLSHRCWIALLLACSLTSAAVAAFARSLARLLLSPPPPIFQTLSLSLSSFFVRRSIGSSSSSTIWMDVSV
jgi:hypothetical protein